MRIIETPIEGGRSEPQLDYRGACTEEEWEAMDHDVSDFRRLNVGCGPFYVEGWLNLDVTFIPGEITPDVVWPAESAPSFESDFDQIYMGHVLEHIPWDKVQYHLRSLRRELAPGGQLLVVGPDVLRSLDLWRQGRIDHNLLLATMEDEVDATRSGELEDYTFVEERWEGSRHHWNAHEARVARAMIDAGFDSVTGVPITEVGPEWPLVSDAAFQCAVLGQVSK